MPTYQYVNNSGGMSTINANTANEALANAQDKEPSSGVGLISTPQGASTTPTPPQSGVITPASLQNNQTPIQVPQPNPSVPPTPSTQPTLAQNLLGSFDLTANEQAATNTQENLLAKMLDNINNLAGESAFRTQVTNESGLGQKKLELQNLNSQILQKQAEIQQSDIQLVANMRAEERRDTLLPFAQAGQAKLAGDAAITRALKTSEIGVLNALALGKQGDIQLAKESINEAVDAKFAPYKEQNAVYEAQLKAIQPFLDKAEKKEAAKMQVKVSLAMKEIDKVSDFQKQILNNAISRNAPQSVLNAINRGQSIEEITKAGRGYLQSQSDVLENAIKSAQLRKLNLENAPQQVADKVFSTTQKISNINQMLSNEAGIRGSAGPTRLQRGGILTVVPRVKFNADIQQLISQTTLDNLINAKAKGATFGALSEGELKLLSASGSRLATWAITDKSGNIKGFKASEKQVKDELNKIKSYAERDYELTTGQKYVPVTEDSFADDLINGPASSPFASLGNPI